MILCESPLIEGSGNDCRVMWGMVSSGLAVPLDRKVYGDYPVVVDWARVSRYRDYRMIKHVGEVGRVILNGWVEMIRVEYPELLEGEVELSEDVVSLRRENVRLRRLLYRIGGIVESGVER